MKTAVLSSTVAICLASPSLAAIEVRFSDGAPWDIFTITNPGCEIAEAELLIDLSTSVAGVLIDTEYGGAGTQDPLPAELSQGNALLAPVIDGDQHLSVTIGTLDKDGLIELRMDVDDTAGSARGPKIQVYADEITGATVTLNYAGAQTMGVFNSQGYARVPLADDAPGCNLLF